MATIRKRDYRRGTKTGVWGKDTKEGKRQAAAKRESGKDDAPFSVIKRAGELFQRRKKVQSQLDAASDSGNEYDRLNSEMEHAKDTDNVRRIFEK